MTDKNPHIGSTFESWLDERGLREEVTAAAIKSVIAEQIAAAMKARGLSKSRMAELMHTSRPQLDGLLDPDNGGATLDGLSSAPTAGQPSRPNAPKCSSRSSRLRIFPLGFLGNASAKTTRFGTLNAARTLCARRT